MRVRHESNIATNTHIKNLLKSYLDDGSISSIRIRSVRDNSFRIVTRQSKAIAICEILHDNGYSVRVQRFKPHIAYGLPALSSKKRMRTHAHRASEKVIIIAKVNYPNLPNKPEELPPPFK